MKAPSVVLTNTQLSLLRRGQVCAAAEVAAMIMITRGGNKFYVNANKFKGGAIFKDISVEWELITSVSD